MSVSLMKERASQPLARVRQGLKDPLLREGRSQARKGGAGRGLAALELRTSAPELHGAQLSACSSPLAGWQRCALAASELRR